MSHAPVFANDPALLPASISALLPPVLENEVRQIYAHSPLYDQRFPLHSEPLHWACFQEIPLLSKKEIVQRGHQAFFRDYRAIESGFTTQAYEYESTGGTTQSPMTVIMEAGWWDAQTARAYRAHPLLAHYADRAYRKCVLAPVGCSSNLCPYEDHPFPHRYFNGTVYLNLSSDPFAFPEAEWDRIVTELQAVQPEVLEGEPIYLSLLARATLRRKVTIPSLRVVILTYGKASRQHAARIQTAFPVPLVDLYGSTEAGYIFIGEAFTDALRVIDENVFVELTPWRGHAEVFQLTVTTRARTAMPLLRYQTGDLVRRTAGGYRLLGRESGVFTRADGQLISPAEIDTVLPDNFACWHYSLVQTTHQRWDFHYVADEVAPAGLENALASLLGADQRVVAFRRRTLTPSASGKFILLKPLQT